jgi:hypothetical protein
MGTLDDETERILRRFFFPDEAADIVDSTSQLFHTLAHKLVAINEVTPHLRITLRTLLWARDEAIRAAADTLDART